jgi:hypothetical protein
MRLDDEHLDDGHLDEDGPAQTTRTDRRRGVAVVTAGVVLAAALFGGGFLTGRAMAPSAGAGSTAVPGGPGAMVPGGQPPALPDGTLPQDPTGQAPQDPTGAGGAADGSSTV